MNKFVSETELDARRKKRQEEWEKTRRPDQPLEAPEEEYDPRSLFERLQANKMKQQEEYDEAKRLKNLIRGLNDEEVSFLEMVDQTKEDAEKIRRLEEKKALDEFKSAMQNLSEQDQEKRLAEFKKSFSIASNKVTSKPATSKRQSSNPLAGLIKPKEDTQLPNLVAYDSDSCNSSELSADNDNDESDLEHRPPKRLKTDS
ncbi:PSME3-interacting protein-like [Brevipalpus obovatus]|uniref:PSME3-interacting protein-like n=1 Tax=Brevipalpus obovatus TaxID=246614 RepID=UPI003D9F22D4